jgi:glyoxylase-like metal-dependent hydrolase (beta-lactamase superfamily II)/rhodanese-related sulfurtransferase
MQGLALNQYITTSTMAIEQIRSTDGTGTLSYLITDAATRLAAIIDPNIEDLAIIQQKLVSQGLNLEYVIDTHTHVDHVSASKELQKLEGATVVMHEFTKDKWKVVEQGDKFGIGDTLRANAAVEIDVYVNEGDTLELGETTLGIIHTPGHTDNHIAIYFQGNLFTGDLLLVGQAGRSDLPGGSAEQQYDSLYNKVLQFDDETKIYPGHDYENNVFVYLGEERKTNEFLLKKSKEEFVDFVKDFFPPIADAQGGKVVLQCGAARVSSGTEKFKNIDCTELTRLRQDPNVLLLDVREPKELATIGCIEGVTKNIPVGQLASRLNELPKDKEIIAICQKGGRSAEAAHILTSNGFKVVYNLTGGTGGWIEKGLPVVKTEKALA